MKRQEDEVSWENRPLAVDEQVWTVPSCELPMYTIYQKSGELKGTGGATSSRIEMRGQTRSGGWGMEAT